MKKEQLEQELKTAQKRISELEADLKIDEMESAPFRYVVEHSVDLIQSVRANGRFEFVNRAWLDSLGYSPEDVKSLELKDVIHPDHWARCDDAFNRIQNGEQIPFIQTVLVGKNQQQILVEGTASARILDGKFHATYSVLRDVTKSRRAEESLQANEMKFRQMAENIHEVFYLTDLKTGTLIYISPAYEQIWGRTTQSLYENMQSFVDAIHAEDRPRVFASLEKQSKGVTTDEEYRVIRLDGSIRWIRDRGFPVLDEYGRAYRVSGITEDITDFKEAEEKYQKAEQRYRDLFENAPVMYVITEMTSGMPIVADCNRFFLTSLGYDYSQVIGRPLADFYSHDSQRKLRESGYKRALKGNLSDERELVTVDGENIPCLIEAVPVQNDAGEVIGTRAAFIDIRKRKEAEELLRLSQEKLNEEMRRHTQELEKRVEERTRELERAYQELQSSAAEIEDLYNNAPCGYHSLNAEGQFVNVNDTLLSWLGRERDEVIGRHIKDFLTRESWKIFDTYFPSLKMDGSAYDQEMDFVRKNGQIFSVSLSASALTDKQGNFLRTRATTFDVSERKRAEQALRDSETYARLLFEASPDPISVADVDGVMIDVNHVFEQQHELAREAAQGRNIRDLGIFADHDLQKAADYIAGVLSGENPAPIELDFPSPDGATHTLELHSYPIVVNNKQLILSTSRDITTHKQAALALRLANAEMERALKLKDEFLANMSHELRTPLNAILGIAESLQNQIGGTLNAKQLKYVQIIRESGTHLLTLITDILDLSKIEAGRMELEFQDVLLEPLCQASLRMVKELAHKKQLNVTFTMDERVQSLHVDERRIKQVLVNLLTNAVKFTSQDGNVGLDVSADPDNTQIHIAVWDSGIGITKEELPRLFKPFVQLDASLSREYSGTGLGLVLVAQMVRLHGGSVSVESQPRKGSRFTITLPWDESKITNITQPHQETTMEQILSNRSGTILLVEDTEAVIFVTSEYLETLGYKVFVARHGEEGIKLAQIHRPDLILMDIQMPGMDGFEATRRIRNEPDLKHIPILAITALAMSGDRERCFAAGMNDYLSKPIILKELAEAIAKHIEKERRL